MLYHDLNEMLVNCKNIEKYICSCVSRCALSGIPNSQYVLKKLPTSEAESFRNIRTTNNADSERPMTHKQRQVFERKSVVGVYRKNDQADIWLYQQGNYMGICGIYKFAQVNELKTLFTIPPVWHPLYTQILKIC